jgi:hypothetical protein
VTSGRKVGRRAAAAAEGEMYSLVAALRYQRETIDIDQALL